jgi:hypothetical protein
LDTETRLESKMRRLLNKYRERKAKELERKKDWHTINREKPNPDIDHTTDKKLIEEASQTMGNYESQDELNLRTRLMVLNYGYTYGRNDVIVVDSPLGIITV